MTEKPCRRCGETKPLSEFYRHKKSKDGYLQRCKACQRVWQLSYHEKNREVLIAKLREYHSKNKERNNEISREYHKKHRERLKWVSKENATGFSKELYEKTLALQGNCCGICGKSLIGLPSVNVHADHCHDTNIPRGILCRTCNHGIGKLGDNLEGLRRAVAYLENPPAQQVVWCSDEPSPA